MSIVNFKKAVVTIKPQAYRALTKAQVNACIDTAQKMLAEKVESQQIPMNEGTLQNVLTDVDDSKAQRGQVSITSLGPYAARLYYNPQYNFNHEFNANARGEWWEDWLTGSKSKRAAKLYSTFYKEGSGGYVK